MIKIFFIILVASVIFDTEATKFLKFMRPIESSRPIEPSRPNEPPQRYRAASHHSATQIKNTKKYERPDGIQRSKNPHPDNTFLQSLAQDYEKNLQALISIDPCLFSPCGANTLCVENKDENHHYSSRYSSRVCYCHYGFIPHLRISETCVRPCDLEDCGENASCVNDAHGNHNCVCNPGYLPVLHGTAHFKGCGDPCWDLKCNPKNTICIPQSANKRVCLCQEGTVPKNGDAAKYGCEVETAVVDRCELNPCTEKNTFCAVSSKLERFCICDEGHIEVDGDAAANGCIPTAENDPCELNPCHSLNTLCIPKPEMDRSCICEEGFTAKEGDAAANGCEEVVPVVSTDTNLCLKEGTCGANTLCSLMNDFTPTCTCKPGFILEAETTAEEEGCAPDPCKEACPGANTICTLMDDQIDFQCTCKPGTYVLGTGTIAVEGCSRLPPNACRVGSFIYSVHDNDFIKPNAQDLCKTASRNMVLPGGYFFEPAPNVDSIKALFAGLTSSCGLNVDTLCSRLFYTGLVYSSPTYTYDTSGISINENNAVIGTPSPPDATIALAAICNNDMGQITPISSALLRPAICQYNVPP